MARYKCPACKKEMSRDSNAPRHRSYCYEKGRMVWMTKVVKKK